MNIKYYKQKWKNMEEPFFKQILVEPNYYLCGTKKLSNYG